MSEKPKWVGSPRPGLDLELEEEWWSGWCLGLLMGLIIGAAATAVVAICIN